MEKPCVPFRPTWWRLFVAEWWMDSYNEYYGAMKDGLKSIPSEMGFKKCYRSDKIHHSSLTLSFPLQKRLWSPIISYLTFSVRRERVSKGLNVIMGFSFMLQFSMFFSSSSIIVFSKDQYLDNHCKNPSGSFAKSDQFSFLLTCKNKFCMDFRQIVNQISNLDFDVSLTLASMWCLACFLALVYSKFRAWCSDHFERWWIPSPCVCGIMIYHKMQTTTIQKVCCRLHTSDHAGYHIQWASLNSK